MTSRHLTFAVACAFLAACSSGKNDDSAPAGGDARADASGGGGGAGGGFTGEVTIASGPDAGTYKYLSHIPCMDYAAMGLGIGGMSDTSVSKVLRLGFSTSKGAKSGSLDDFELSFAVDRGNMQEEAYKIEPKKGTGTGTATISGSAPEYTVSVDGKTATGVGVKSTMHCTK